MTAMREFDTMIADYLAYQDRYVSYVIYRQETGEILQEGTARNADLMTIRMLHTDADIRIMEGVCDDCDAFEVRDGEIVPIKPEVSE